MPSGRPVDEKKLISEDESCSSQPKVSLSRLLVVMRHLKVNDAEVAAVMPRTYNISRSGTNDLPISPNATVLNVSHRANALGFSRAHATVEMWDVSFRRFYHY
ncbi:hypothetical protein KIN20_012637 [Parelaphostrongylus tenuis]|uniref:Uncharacterized protein n=1 Tax=Parelaphostrongylus tenuis TaxID=148309 RepID=A0AAD5MV03_PARTN|nr:hypothetical protein KIN20_012637 [Parelaphostrongylus tenuis]